jgi:[ribosomal protein S18]-alanine N-acetyltransferase
LIIAPLQRKDLPELLLIESASFAHPWSEALFLEELGKNPRTLFGARKTLSGPLAGYICFWVVDDEIQVANLAVNPDYRRQGIARALMSFLLNLVRDTSRSNVFLEVRPSNLSALSLYHALGFKVLYRRPNYYAPEGEDALVMEWSEN